MFSFGKNLYLSRCKSVQPFNLSVLFGTLLACGMHVNVLAKRKFRPFTEFWVVSTEHFPFSMLTLAQRRQWVVRLAFGWCWFYSIPRYYWEWIFCQYFFNFQWPLKLMFITLNIIVFLLEFHFCRIFGVLLPFQCHAESFGSHCLKNYL